MKFFVACVAAFLAVLDGARGREFDLRRDTFHFANETAWAYGVDERGRVTMSARDTPARYAHGCFLLTRAVMQFHQFARFAPELPKLSRERYGRLIRKISRIPVWSRGRRERIAIPGFADLRSFSVAYEGLLKENLGRWWPTYIRPGNYRMPMPHPRAGQARLARWLEDSIEAGKLRALYLSRFPHMNHAVLAIGMRREARGNMHFELYDPNYPGQSSWMRYVAARRSFDFQKRWYFPGGQVNAMRIYLSPLH